MSAKPKSTNTCAPGAKKYLEKILSKSRKLWTTKLTVVFFIKPNAPSVSDDIDVIPDNGFNKGFFSDSFGKRFNVLPCIVTGWFGETVP